jgi:hypothetical protein
MTFEEWFAKEGGAGDYDKFEHDLMQLAWDAALEHSQQPVPPDAVRET